ncbi:(d)CMP kinase [Spiroplasma culicicola]|uniref:Cytidylate kinase n=1 Tax=Spiroplasma culicicola AES-1 TaxID=1276246 RepID=W6A709_9MOLU|nr:(d)CMP kinase [Spiroplasma culicicola]AHI52660.1 cytidylate kinase [Spiroplasma culicicola AES-1]
MDKKINIAVDGTASSGKSSVMSAVAKQLGFDFIDTGLMYRAYTKLCLMNNIDFSKEEQIVSLLDQFDCQYKENDRIFVGQEELTSFLSDYEVAENIKYVAATVKVREKMVELQKKLAEPKNKILVGRDITTVVLPDAELKIYFDSSAEARAQRRFLQNQRNNVEPNVYEDILRQIQQRDEWDKNRAVGALTIAPDAWLFDTSNINIDQAIEIVIEKIKNL